MQRTIQPCKNCLKDAAVEKKDINEVSSKGSSRAHDRQQGGREGRHAAWSSRAWVETCQTERMSRNSRHWRVSACLLPG